MGEIKPIPTHYNGYHFRSRLEARWAVFFDAVGIKYEYEPEGFEANGVRYLPDFYLPDADRWIEIKGKKLSKNEIEKCSAFCETQDRDGVKFTVFIGQPFDLIVGMRPSSKNAGNVEIVFNPDDAVLMGIKGFSYQWKNYDIIHNPGGKLEHIENDKMLFVCPDLCEEEILTRFMPMIWHDANVTKKALIIGALKARQARFEHGETPTI